MIKHCLRLVLPLAVAWFVMIYTHEFGHLAGGHICGGHLVDLELRPWRLPYSLFDPDPNPLVRLWSGPFVGALLPFLVASALRRRTGWLFSHFAWLANGLYLAVAWVTGDRYLDTTQLIEHGGSRLMIAAYCVLTISVGYVGLRRHFRQPREGQTADCGRH